MKRTLFWVAGITLLASAVLVYDRCVILICDGQSEMVLDFQVVDAASGQPIHTATIHAKTDETEVIDDRSRNKRVDFAVDAQGKVRSPQLRVYFTNIRGSLGIFYSSGVSIPYWSVCAAAPGYQTCNWIDVYRTHVGKEQRKEDGPYRLFVRIPLKAAVPAP